MGKVPAKAFEVFEDFVDDFIADDFGTNCKLYFPPKRVPCNCSNTNTTPAGGSTNVFDHGGPAPFNLGSCPLCGGDGYKEVAQTEIIKLRVYYRQRDFIKVANVNLQEGTIQVIGKNSDLPAFLRADEIEPDLQMEGFQSGRYVRSGPVYPHGFKRRRYFLCYLIGA